MKKLLLMIMLFTTGIAFSQLNPTLGVGLETLTFNKGSIDVEVLTKVIIKKQKELKNEALKRFMLKMFPSTDYTTRFYVQNCLNILLNEKNPQVIEKEILELTTNYAIALGVTKAICEIDETIFTTNVPKLNSHIDYNKILNDLNFKTKIDSIIIKTKAIKTENDKIIQESKGKNDLTKISVSINKIKDYEKDIKIIKRKLARKGVKIDLTEQQNDIPSIQETLNFGEKLDLVSLALSENDLLRKKGFFKNKIDYTEDQGYFYDEINDKNILQNIDTRIKPYIENYDIIKNFIENNSINSSENIVETLNKIYLNQINLESSYYTANDGKTSNEGYKREIEKLRGLLKLKKDFENLSSLKNIYTNQINAVIINPFVAINKLKDIENIKELKIENLEALKNSYSNLRKVYDYVNNLNKVIKDIKDNPLLGNTPFIGFAEDKISFPTINFIGENESTYFNELIRIRDDINSLKSDDNNQIGVDITPEVIQENNSKKLILINGKIDEFNKRINLINDNIKSNMTNILVLNQNIESINIKIATLNNLDLKDSLEKNKEQIKIVQEKISKLPEFFTVFINDLLNKIETQPINQTLNSQKDLTSLITKIYERLNYFKNNKNYTITDINYLENELLPQLVGIKFSDVKENKDIYDFLIKNIKNLTPLLKINILVNKKLDKLTIKYDEKLISLFEFIGNLDKLDKAQTYTSIVDLIKKNSEDITKILPDGAFKDSYALFINGIKKYTLINTDKEKQYVEIDVVSFLDDMQQHYQRNNPSIFSLYLSIGLNQNMFINKFQFTDSSETLNSIGFASEKIGVKWKILDFKRFRGYENAIKSDIYLNKRAPFINEFYTSIYGSGLLYSLANTATNENFNFPHVGASLGLRFYNALDLNLMIGLPFVKDQKFGNNGFIGIGFDIPLGEYLEALGTK